MITKVEYDSIVISDHCPVLLRLRFPENIPPKCMRRLNSRLLADKKFVDFINTQIDLFLETNQSPEISYCTLWETMKAYVRGQVISYAAGENKKKFKRVTELIDRIKVVDQLHSTSPCDNLYRERILLQTEFDSLTNDNAIDLYLRTRHKFYEYGERASKLLSHQLKQSATAGFISSIKDDKGSIVTDQRDINAQFKSFYENLYNSEAGDTESVNNFFSKLEMPSLNLSDKSKLEGCITEMEIDSAIKRMKPGKAPGPDGFPIEFFKTFGSKLIPLLLKVFEEILVEKRQPPIMTQASISLLLKKNKDPLICESYRPFSLLCSDYKILTKVLADRLQKSLPKLIHSDQTGFIVGRQLSSNLRRVFNIIYQPNNIEPEIILSLDAQKAFDRIEYNYLFATLERFGFGATFCSWIKIIYTAPQASIRTNKIISDYFSLSRGTRQGCPLSPQLFDIAIEPLAIMLR